MPGGRPRIYETPEEMEEDFGAFVSHYYEERAEGREDPPTKAELLIALGFSGYSTLDLYHEREEFMGLVGFMELWLAQYWERALYTKPQGAKFWMTNLRGGHWAEKREEKHEGTVNLAWIEADGDE